MIKNTLQKQIQEALKAGDSVRVSTLRLLYSALHNEEINKQKELNSEEELVIIQRQLKQRNEAVEAYEKGGRQDLSDKEKQEAAILKEFLPEQMSDEELLEIVERVVGEMGEVSFGQVMGGVMVKVKGRADGARVRALVGQKLGV